MITEKELDEMAREMIPGDDDLSRKMRENWKSNYRQMSEIVEPSYTTGAAHMPPERVENGRQFQEEMIHAGFNKLKIEYSPNLHPHGVDLTIDVSDAREHFQHVIALVANTATQRAYRQTLETLENALMYSEHNDVWSPLIHKYTAHLTQCLSELEAQFADLSEKIFGTDKPLTDEGGKDG